MRELFAGARGRVVVGLLVGEFMTAAQALVVATIMPQIVRDLHGLALYWIPFSALLVAQFLVTIFAGPWVDRYGPQRLLAIGYLVFGAGLALAASAQAMPFFLLARVLEGVGGGIDYVSVLAIIARVFPEDVRPKMFALSSAMWVVPALVGPSFGAFIATALGWRYAFWSFLPLVVLSASLVLPAVRGLTGTAERTDAFASLRLLFSLRTIMATDARGASFLALALLHAAFFGADAYVALMLTAVRGLSLNLAGLCITLAALGWSASALWQPSLLKMIGSRRVVALGAALGIAAILGLVAVDLGAPVFVAFGGWFLGGGAIGLGYSTISLLSLAGAAEGAEGTISSATLLSGLLGMALGVAVCGLPITALARPGAALGTALLGTFGLAAAFAGGLLALSRRLAEG